MSAIRKEQYVAMRGLMAQGLDDKAIAKETQAPIEIIASYRTDRKESLTQKSRKKTSSRKR